MGSVEQSNTGRVDGCGIEIFCGGNAAVEGKPCAHIAGGVFSESVSKIRMTEEPFNGCGECVRVSESN